MRTDNPASYNLKVRLFAILRDVVGQREISISVPSGVTVRYLNNEILKKYPQLNSFSNKFVTSVNYKVTSGDTIITSSDEIALLPPVSGG